MTELPIVQKLLESIVQSPQHVIALDTDHPADLLAQMRVLSIRAGTSIYAWDPEGGIAPLRETGLYVPGTKRLADALRYVLQSMHFGIYLFVDFDAFLKPAETLFLRRISRMEMHAERKAVFIGRPMLYGLGVAGEAGFTRVLDIIRSEADTTLGLMGETDVNAIGPHNIFANDLVRPQGY